MKIIYSLLICLSFSQFSTAQLTRSALFIGNSYTYSNDMPGMISSLANADGHTLIKDQNTPGGFTLEGHSTSTSTLFDITNISWDFVVLQEQSQLPSFPWSQVTADVFPYAEILCDSIRSANPCAMPVFFNTWGRRDGDSQWDSINTFDKMNERLLNAYTTMSDMNSTLMAPIGVGFNHIQDDGSSPITHTQLYSADGSHPSVYGTYLGACVFYEIIFKISSVGNTFVPGSISGAEATYLQGVAHHILNDVDSLQLDFTQPIADFSYTTNGTSVNFNNLSQHSFDWYWDFDNGANSTDENPINDFGNFGTYDVTLTANYCGSTHDTTITVNVAPASITHQEIDFEIFPNPSINGEVNIISSQPAEINIYNLSGQLLEQGMISSKHTLHLESGFYLIQVGNSFKKITVL